MWLKSKLLFLREQLDPRNEMEMPRVEEIQPEATKIYFESILGRLRQISREISQLRTLHESVERKVEALHYRLDAELTPETRDKEVRDGHRISQSDKGNVQHKRNFGAARESIKIVKENRKRQKQGVNLNENKAMASVFASYEFASAASAVKKVQQIQARQREGRSPKTLRSSRRKVNSKDPKGYWKLDFTDTSTQSP